MWPQQYVYLVKQQGRGRAIRPPRLMPTLAGYFASAAKISLAFQTLIAVQMTFAKKKDTPIFDKITEGNNPKMSSVPALLVQLAVELRYDAPASPPAHQEPVAGLYPLPLES
jgi:hypothetical protein